MGATTLVKLGLYLPVLVYIWLWSPYAIGLCCSPTISHSTCRALLKVGRTVRLSCGWVRPHVQFWPITSGPGHWIANLWLFRILFLSVFESGNVQHHDCFIIRLYPRIRRCVTCSKHTAWTRNTFLLFYVTNEKRKIAQGSLSFGRYAVPKWQEHGTLIILAFHPPTPTPHPCLGTTV